MVEVVLPSEVSHETLGFPAASPILSASEPDDDNTDITDFGSDVTGAGAIMQVNKISGHLCADTSAGLLQGTLVALIDKGGMDLVFLASFGDVELDGNNLHRQ
jgi:hypothetical protein